ncbi:MAG: cyclic nucleotide-binding protein [Archangium gephyra]|uniref:Cyclic nucleotide-binding protein n=1 Tax=Archangium gephyra TaxID=48 RepID=A0A2W5TPZ0_9BACT|nr:MAG: cyclic nucleotide-binding protein [Archangium gephyra]
MKDEADLLEWLPSIAIFGGLEPATLKRIVALLGEHRIDPDEEICKQGEAGRAMFLVREGEVLVCRDTEEGRRVKMVRLGPGEFFGEMTLIDIQKRSATVVAAKPSLLFSLGNRDLYKLYMEDVAGYVMVLQNICRELSRRLRVTNKRLQDLATEVDEDDGRTLIRPAIKRL